MAPHLHKPAYFARKSLLPPPPPTASLHPFEHSEATDFPPVMAIARRETFDRMPFGVARAMHRKLLPIVLTWPLELVFELSTTRLWHAGWPEMPMPLPARFDRRLRDFWVAHLFWCLRRWGPPREIPRVVVGLAILEL